MAADVDQLMREMDALFAHMLPWRSDWQLIADLSMPGQSDILNLQTPGTNRTRHLYDSTMMWSLNTFVGHLTAWITNFQMLFFKYRMRALLDDQASSKWLDEISEITWSNMVANEAPQTTAVPETHRFSAGMGTGAMFLDAKPINPDDPSTGFQGWQAWSLTPGSYAVAENATGRVDKMYRKFDYSAEQAVEQWGLSALASPMIDMLVHDDPRRFEKHEFVHVVRPRRGRDSSRDDAKNMKFESVYIDMQNHHIVSEGGFRWFPYIVHRWDKLSSFSPYGFGLGHMALGEARTLQVIDRDLLSGLSMDIRPSGWLTGASREAARNVVLMPGIMNALAAGGNFIPYQSGKRIDSALLQINERRERILRTFFIDQLQFLPAPESRTQRTLGELQLRARQMMRIMGPYMQRLIPEFLNPLIEINFAVNLAAGEFPDPPDSVIEAANNNAGTIDIEYTGDLVRSSRDGESEALIEGIEFLTNAAQQTQDPLLLQNIEIDDSVAKYLESRGYPEGLIKDRRLMQEIRAEAQRAQAESQAAQQDMVDAQIARDAAPMLREVREAAGV